MAVHQVEEYYVFIQFKKELTDEQRREVVSYLGNSGYAYEYRCSNLSLDVENLENDAAIEFDDAFSKKFSNLIK